MHRPLYQRTNDGLCLVCSNPRPPRRGKYCSDACYHASKGAREADRQQRRMTACKRCGGEKELGTRGGKYCESCRVIIGDTTKQMEYERGRRKSVAKNLATAAAGRRISRRIIEAPEGTKWCARCQQFRPLDAYTKHAGKMPAYCQPCQRFYNMERRLLHSFGLTWDEYELLLACQDGRCAICGGQPRKHLLSVDHDHKTGEVRGLLCSRCNHRLLGSANDDPARLRRAADYLEEFTSRDVFGQPKYVPGFQKASHL